MSRFLTCRGIASTLCVGFVGRQCSGMGNRLYKTHNPSSSVGRKIHKRWDLVSRVTFRPVSVVASDMKEPVVSTSCGRLRGVFAENVEGGSHVAFKGIPYAQAPIGELRFQDPKPPKAWDDIRDASRYGQSCGQLDPITHSIVGGDDCLYLNVFVSSLELTQRLPVMVWIHGGAFMFGSANDDLYGPDFLVKHDIVLVTINYRVGVLGFLNLEDAAAPGNQGLKDQVMALKWVKENIANFGGDPNNVTIFGESAGAASVHYLSLSPMAKGLFHKAICQSGVAINNWARSSPNPRKNAERLCAQLGITNTEDPKHIVEKLREVNIQDLIDAQEKIRTAEEKIQVVFQFGPAVDVTSKNPFLAECPLVATNRGLDIPCLYGYNNREGIIFISALTSDTSFKILNSNFDKCISPYVKELLKSNNKTTDDLRRSYFGGEEITDKHMLEYADMTGDLHFVHGIQDSVKAHVEKNRAPAYLYRFTYDKGISLSKISVAMQFDGAEMEGACHFDECAFLFHHSLLGSLGMKQLQNEIERTLMKRMTNMWTDFAKTGRPTLSTSDLINVDWQPVTSGTDLRYLNIDVELQMENTPHIVHRITDQKLGKSKL